MMALIVGLLPYESGKTTVAKYLISEAVERGFDVGVSKPICAVNGWYNYSCMIKSLKYRKLIGEDVYKLHKAARSLDPIEIENPFALLLMPPDPERVEWRSSSYTALSIIDQVVLIRISTPNKTVHMFIPSNANRLTKTLREELERLKSNLNPTPKDLDYEDLDGVILKAHAIVDDCVKRIVDIHEFTIVESYSDAAAPTKGSLNADVVIAVAPSKLAIYTGEFYKKALIAISSIREPWLTKTEEILPLLNPIKTIELKPFKRIEILDHVLNAMKSY